jgi:hypothetical protein
MTDTGSPAECGFTRPPLEPEAVTRVVYGPVPDWVPVVAKSIAAPVPIFMLDPDGIHAAVEMDGEPAGELDARVVVATTDTGSPAECGLASPPLEPEPVTGMVYGPVPDAMPAVAKSAAAAVPILIVAPGGNDA